MSDKPVRVVEMTPEEFDRAYRTVRHRNKSESVVPRSRIRLGAAVMPPANPALLERLKEKCPLPDVIPSSPKRLAEQVGAKFYWSDQGCRHHGRPTLRYTSWGRCVACCMDEVAREKVQTKRRKASQRIPLDQLPTRQIDAIALNYKTFFTGRPCQRGHIAERYARNKACCQCTNPGYTLPPKTAPDPAAPRIETRAAHLVEAADNQWRAREMLRSLQPKPTETEVDLDSIIRGDWKSPSK